MAREIAISLPFTFDSFKKVGSTVDQRKVWADRVRSVIGTSLRERVMRPTFGTIIPFSLFESEDNAEAEVEAEIKSAFLIQLPLLTLQEVTVTYSEPINTMLVDIIYALPNDVVVNTQIGYVIIQGTRPVIEELL